MYKKLLHLLGSCVRVMILSVVFTVYISTRISTINTFTLTRTTNGGREVNSSNVRGYLPHLLSRLRANDTSYISTRPITTHFIYHAVGKTGSFETRDHLRLFCYEYNLTCLAGCPACGLCVSDMSNCLGKRIDVSAGHLNGGDGDFTVFKMTHGCCPNFVKTYQHTGFDALVDHFPLYNPDNKKLLETHFPADSIRFITIRDPVEHFISFHRMLYTREKHGIAMSDLTYCIKLFYNAFVSGVQPLNTYEKHKFMLMTNYQSKFLGYSGIINDTKTAKQALEYLRTQIHVVGLTEQLSLSWKLFRLILNWPSKYFTNQFIIDSERNIKRYKYVVGNRLRKSVADDLTPELRRMIETFSWVDMLVYKEAKIIFSSYNVSQLWN